MNRTCIVVADAGLARFYDIEEVESPRLKMKLVERAVLTNETDLKVLGQSVTGRVRTETNTDRGSGPVHPMGRNGSGTVSSSNGGSAWKSPARRGR